MKDDVIIFESILLSATGNCGKNKQFRYLHPMPFQLHTLPKND
jgi:hypothetical protein